MTVLEVENRVMTHRAVNIAPWVPTDHFRVSVDTVEVLVFRAIPFPPTRFAVDVHLSTSVAIIALF
jgi:hypothetical protein